MPAGLQVFLSGGVVQIDQDYKNPVVIASGSRASGDWAISGLTYFVNIAVTAIDDPMIAYRCTSQVGLAGVSISGSTWTFTLRTDNPAALDWWVFDDSPASPSSQYIEIFDATGARVFNGLQKPLRPVGEGAGTYASGRTYAVIPSGSGYQYYYEDTGLPPPDQYIFRDFIETAAISGVTVSVSGIQTGYADFGVTYDINFAQFNPTVFLVVDVTHF